MDSTVSYVNIFIKFIKFSDIKGMISQEIRQFNHTIFRNSGHLVKITKGICFIKQWNMFLIEKCNIQLVGWLRSAKWVPFYVILRVEIGPDNHNRRFIYVHKQS